jgi:hypothetical protein
MSNKKVWNATTQKKCYEQIKSGWQTKYIKTCYMLQKFILLKKKIHVKKAGPMLTLPLRFEK